MVLINLTSSWKMKKTILLLIFLILVPISNSSASAGDNETLTVARWYKVYWGGLHVADLVAGINGSRFDTIIKSYGIVKKFSNYSSSTTSYFDVENGKYIPKSFFTEFQQRKRHRTIDIKYNENGGILDEAVNPPDNRAKRPAVDVTLKDGSVDPLTAVMIAREKIRESLENGNTAFSFNMYDGRRLASLDFKLNGRKKTTVNGKEHDVIEVTFRRNPIAGFTHNELKRMKSEEPDFTLYLSDDENLLPVKADMDAELGVAVLLLERECKSISECIGTNL